MILALRHLLGWMISAFRSREDLVLENLALHQQLLALHAQRPRSRLSALHKLFWVAPRTIWAGGSTTAWSWRRDFWPVRCRKTGHPRSPRRQFRRAHSVRRRPTDGHRTKTIDMRPHRARPFERLQRSGT